jgi:tetratricopeptide (TPR) repeat protein
MIRAKAQVLLLAAVAVWMVACAPATRFGDKARYAPEYRGYIVGDPDHGNPLIGEVALLRDPITGRKLRCREEVVARLPRAAESLARYAREDNATAESALGLYPLFGTGVVLVLLGNGLALTAELPAQVSASRSSTNLVRDAVKEMDRRDYAAAALLLERALARDERPHGAFDTSSTDFSRTRSPALHHLGLSYAALGRSRQAIVALDEFVETSSRRDEKAYALSERWLSALGRKPKTCASQEDVPIRWADVR